MTDYDQFRASLANPVARRGLGIDVSDTEAARIASDPALARAYFENWSNQNSAVPSDFHEQLAKAAPVVDKLLNHRESVAALSRAAWSLPEPTARAALVAAVQRLSRPARPSVTTPRQAVATTTPASAELRPNPTGAALVSLAWGVGSAVGAAIGGVIGVAISTGTGSTQPGRYFVAFIMVLAVIAAGIGTYFGVVSLQIVSRPTYTGGKGIPLTLGLLGVAISVWCGAAWVISFVQLVSGT